MHILFNTTSIFKITSIYIYGLLHRKQMGSSRSCFGYFHHLNKCEFIYIYLILAL